MAYSGGWCTEKNITSLRSGLRRSRGTLGGQQLVSESLGKKQYSATKRLLHHLNPFKNCFYLGLSGLPPRVLGRNKIN